MYHAAHLQKGLKFQRLCYRVLLPLDDSTLGANNLLCLLVLKKSRHGGKLLLLQGAWSLELKQGTPRKLSALLYFAALVCTRVWKIHAHKMVIMYSIKIMHRTLSQYVRH